MLPWMYEKWYKIEKGRALTDNEIGFAVELVMGMDRGVDPVNLDGSVDGFFDGF
jgi:hypothetical protein